MVGLSTDGNYKTEMYEATPEVAKAINQIVQFFVSEGKGKPHVAMSLAISVCCQVFLAHGGKLEKSDEVGEMIKQGVITTLAAYKDYARTTPNTAGRA